MKQTKTINYVANKRRILVFLILIILMCVIGLFVMKYLAKLQLDERLRFKLNNTVELMVNEINLEYERDTINLKYTSLDNSIRYSLYLDLFYQLETTCNNIQKQGNISDLVVVDTNGDIIYSSFRLFKRGQRCPIELKEFNTSGQYYNQGIYDYSYYPVTVDHQLVGGMFTFSSLSKFSKIIDRYLEDKELQLTYELWESIPEREEWLNYNNGMEAVKEGYPDLSQNKLNARAWLKKDAIKYLNLNMTGTEDWREPYILLMVSDHDYDRMHTEAKKQGSKYFAYLSVLFMIALLGLDSITRVGAYRNIKIKLTLENLRMQKHEFLRHINIVNGLLQHNEIDKLKKYLDSVTASVSYFYDMSKLLNPAIEILIKEKEEECQRKDIFFDFKTNSMLENVRFDDFDLCTILGNLLDNAIEAVMRIDSFRKIDLEINNQMGIYLFIISNNGPVISRKEMNKIFRRGYTKKEYRKGHGIGLTIVKKIVRKYHGNMEVESSNSRTVFTVCLPE